MYYKLYFNTEADWLAFGWVSDGEGTGYYVGPQNQKAVAFANYFLTDEGEREPRAGFLVDIEGPLEEGMAEYALTFAPVNAKHRFLGEV